jgi:hypothetical protein
MPVLFNTTGAHFVYDTDNLADDDGAGLHLGEHASVVDGRTVHVEVSADPLPAPSNGYLYFFYAGDGNSVYSNDFARSYAYLSPIAGNQTKLMMYERFSPDASGWALCQVTVPDEDLRSPVLLSFSMRVFEHPDPDKYNVDLSIYMNGARLADTGRQNRTYDFQPGNMTLGRRHPCPPGANGCLPFFGTLRSITIDTQPLDFTMPSYGGSDACMVTLDPEAETTSAATTTGAETTTAAMSTTPSIVLTGRDLDGGGAVGLGDEEDTGNQGKSVPLTLILVLSGVAVLFCLALGGLLVVRSRQSQRSHVGRTSGGQQKSSSSSDQPLVRSRSSKRRRGGDGNYAKVGEHVTTPDPAVATDYTMLPVKGDLADSGYRSMPSVAGGDEYGVMPASGSGYTVIERPSPTSGYADVDRSKEVSPPEESYASGDLAA